MNAQIVTRIPDRSVVIPTRHRAGNIKSLRYFNQPETILVVEPHDADNYLREHPGIKVFVLPEDNRCVQFARRTIMDASEGSVMQVDDDILALRKWSGHNWPVVKAPEDVKTMISDIFTLCEKQGVGICGPLYDGDGRREKTISRYRRGLRVWGIVATNAPRLEKLRINYDLSIPFFGDLDIEIQIINKGLLALIDNFWWWKNVPMSTNAGGLGDFRNADAMRDAALKFKRKWSNVTTLKLSKRGFIEPYIKWSKINER